MVVPVFNEEDAIPVFYREVREKLTEFDIEILFINDGSKDSTEKVISALADNDPAIKAINFTRNFGKEPALLAGLEHASGDVVIPIDVDLQDPIDVIPKLISKWQEGWQVVLAKRIDRTSDSNF